MNGKASPLLPPPASAAFAKALDRVVGAGASVARLIVVAGGNGGLMTSLTRKKQQVLRSFNGGLLKECALHSKAVWFKNR